MSEIFHNSIIDKRIVSMCSSVVICTKDRPNDLFKCIQSITQQSVLPKELIVVDAGKKSIKDNILEFINNIPMQLIYFKHKPSTTAQRNSGVVRSTGAIIFFLDDDTELEEDYIKNMLEVYKINKNIAGVQGTIINDYPPNSFLMRLFRKLFLLVLQRHFFTDNQDEFMYHGFSKGE